MLLNNNLQILLSNFHSIYFAVAATIFYKKSFQLKWMWTILAFILAGYLTIISFSLRLPSLAVGLIICLYSWPILKTCNIWTFLTFVVAIVDPSTVLYTNKTIFTITIAMIAAIPQFIRCQPCKSKLREVRANLGPVYILYVLKTALLIYNVDKRSGQMLVISFLSATIAGVFFRPDNGALLPLLSIRIRTNRRKFCHRILMIFSFMWYAVVVIIKMTSIVIKI